MELLTINKTDYRGFKIKAFALDYMFVYLSVRVYIFVQLCISVLA